MRPLAVDISDRHIGNGRNRHSELAVIDLLLPPAVGGYDIDYELYEREDPTLYRVMSPRQVLGRHDERWRITV